ncbi:signal peptidase [Chryseobacterium schmidteae]|uniref:signal peptidase n=1 Tax=Chryseobacterium schmidteae TaxID=2730404 RepID=UPI001589A1DD|nr:signal peptidase [Chryseobacterium schmidteae]
MKNKLFILLALFISHISLFAQSLEPAGPNNPPDPQVEGNGFGAQATSPIDMYVYVLAIVAILAITYFAKKYKTQKI